MSVRSRLKTRLVNRGIDGSLPRWFVTLAICWLGLKQS